MIEPNCRACTAAAFILRRIGFRDNISWGCVPDSPNDIVHAWHSNASHTVERSENDFEYNERMHKGKDTRPKGAVKFLDDVKSPLCSKYRSELAWLMAGRTPRLTVYMAHPVAGDFHDNVNNATIWYRYLRRLGVSELSGLIGVNLEQKPLILAPWLAGIEDDEMSPGGREGVLADCRDTVTMFDEVWFVGGRVSSGMHIEGSVARVARDLSHLGKLPPVPRIEKPVNVGRRKTKKAN